MDPLDEISQLRVCDLCGADISLHGLRVASGHQSLLGVSVPLSTVMCQRCRFVFQLERFSDVLLAALYERDTSFNFGETDNNRLRVRACLAERQAVISAALTANGLTARNTILDVGGGRGECCQHLVDHHRVVVADVSESAPVDPRIEKVSGLFSAGLEIGSFNAVVMNHILEHVFSPSHLLSAAYRLLKDDGIVIAEVPFELYTPLVARRLGDWRHVSYFCRATLRQFLENSGFVVLRNALEGGCYDVRHLPVVRAIGRKSSTLLPPTSPQNSPLVLARDMIAPAVLTYLAKRFVHR